MISSENFHLYTRVSKSLLSEIVCCPVEVSVLESLGIIQAQFRLREFNLCVKNYQGQ